MIKRFRFVTRRAGSSLDDFSAAWVAAVALVRRAPAHVAPLRAVACTVLRDVAGTTVPHDGIGIEWFADLDALRRFEAWLETKDGRAGVIEPEASSVFLAEEHVARGADWLAQRWRHGAVKLKHMALARRAEGLSADEFSQRWRNKAGTAGSAPIPEAAKGRAYVQNHALADGRYDAVNEVYFDDLEAMRSRIEYFARIDVGRAEAALVRETSFVAVSERIV